jgi:hypothetical protein
MTMLDEIERPADRHVCETFKELGARIESRWNAELRAEAAFPRIAAEEIAGSGILDTVNVSDVVGWMLSRRDIPQQQYRDFGDPPLNLFIGDGFFVEGILWKEGDTAIHEHSFVGAFAVLHGSSLHVRYRTKPVAVESRGYITCESDLVGAEFLTRGAVRSIEKGPGLTHSLFHLESPTFSIVARTDGDSSYDQHVLFPGYALVLTDLKEPEGSLVRLMETLAVVDPATFQAHLSGVIASWSRYAAWRVVSAGLKACPDTIDELRRTAGADVSRRLAMLIPPAKQQLEVSAMLRAYSGLRDSELRAFVALLMNVPSRREILRLLSLRHALEDPTRVAARMMEKFAEHILAVNFDGALAEAAHNALIREENDAKHVITNDKLSRVWKHIATMPLFRSLLDTA